MKIKTTIVTIGMTGILLASPLAVSAQSITGTKAANQAVKLANLHTVADTAVINRLTSLNNALTRLSGLVKLSNDEKTKFSGEVTTNVNGLTSLKAKADADTDLATLSADYKSIFTTYRIYAEFLPQLHLLIASDTMEAAADKLSDFAAKLQTRITKAGNPASLKSLLSDMQAKIADAKTQYSNVQSQITPLTPQSYDNDPTGTKSILQTARGEIKTGAGDLRTAWSDAKQILLALKVNITSPSPAQ